MLDVQLSAKHKVVGVPINESVRNLFPSAKELVFDGKPYLVVPHAPIETFMLRKLGYDVPAPILSQYSWPHPLDQEPFEAQRKTAALFTVSNRAYALNGMGTGKTRAALWAWDYLRGNGLCGKLLVVAPLSTLSFTWAREVFATLPHRKCVVLHGTRARRLEKLADPDAEIFLINHDGVKVLYDALMAMDDLDCVVLDELAVYRNPSAERTKAIRKISHTKMKWVWGMTGAPIPNSPTDAWAQASIVTPHTVPKTFGRFRDELMLKVAQFKWVPKSDAVDRAFAALQPAVRFTLDDVTELPEAVGLNPPRMIDVELGPNQAKIYKALADSCYAAVQSQEITAANAGACMMKLLQVAAGWVYTRDGKTVSLDNSKRIEALLDAINGTDRKVLVFASFKHALAGISEALKGEGIEHAVVSGDTSEGNRAQTFNLFQNTDKYRVLLAHPQCLAHGITLTAADTVIWFGPVTSLEIYDQANHRIRRVGQKHKQLFLHLQSTPVEKHIYTLLSNKQRVQDSLLELFEAATS
jgi:SNF2 family DNA or RNA helicase